MNSSIEERTQHDRRHRPTDRKKPSIIKVMKIGFDQTGPHESQRPNGHSPYRQDFSTNIRCRAKARHATAPKKRTHSAANCRSMVGRFEGSVV